MHKNVYHYIISWNTQFTIPLKRKESDCTSMILKSTSVWNLHYILTCKPATYSSYFLLVCDGICYIICGYWRRVLLDIYWELLGWREKDNTSWWKLTDYYYSNSEFSNYFSRDGNLTLAQTANYWVLCILQLHKIKIYRWNYNKTTEQGLEKKKLCHLIILMIFTI